MKNKEKRQITIEAIQENPYDSNRAIAEILNQEVTPAYIGKLRRKLEAEGLIPKITKRVSIKGLEAKTPIRSFPEKEKREKPLQIFSSQNNEPKWQPAINVYSLIEEELAKLSDEDIINIFQPKIEQLIKQELKSRRNNQLEQAINNLIKEDLAQSYHLDYLNWINRQEELNRFFAKRTYEILIEYDNITLPDWEIIKEQYQLEKLEYSFKPTKKEILIDTNKIVIRFPYDPDLLKQVKSLKCERHYEPDYHHWEFDYKDALKISSLQLEKEDFEIDPNLEGVILLAQVKEKFEKHQLEEKAEKAINLLNSIDLDKPLPNGWNLYEHQKEGIKWLISRNTKALAKGGILADDMGLGKTLQALAAAKELSSKNNDCPIILICPVSLQKNWLREANIIDVDINVYSWGKIPLPLTTEYILIADEAHYAQNLKAKRTQNLLNLAQSDNCIASWLLTGTPSKNGRPSNLFPLLLICQHQLSEDKKAFEKRYCNGYWEQRGSRTFWNNKGANYLEELSELTKDVILRRTKEECLDLPEKTRIKVPVELTQKTQDQLNQEIAEEIEIYKRECIKGKKSINALALFTLNKIRKINSNYKVECAIEKAEELLEQNQSVVIFTEFQESAIEINKKLGGELMYGDVPPEKRQIKIDKFQSNETKIFTSTIKTGGVGLTLTASSNVILVDRPWTPGDAEQAEDRCYRIGQKNSVTSFWLQLGDTDKDIDQLILNKQRNIDIILSDKDESALPFTNIAELAKALLEKF